MGNQDLVDQEMIQKTWHAYLTTGELPDYVGGPWYTKKRLRSLYFHLPSNPRCRLCFYPFKGIGGVLMRSLFHIEPSRLNPHICNLCEQFLEKYQGGAEVELAILFADVRGSTSLAEEMSPTEFSKLINRFYNATTRVLFECGAMVEKLSGDAVTGFFTPGIVGPDYARVALQAGKDILLAVSQQGLAGAAIPVGVGIHTGPAFVGAVSSDSGVSNMVVLGDTANIGARLAALAAPGKIIISQDTARLAKVEAAGAEIRQVDLKGRSHPIEIWEI